MGIGVGAGVSLARACDKDLRRASTDEPGPVVRGPGRDVQSERLAQELRDALGVEHVHVAGAAAPVVGPRAGQHPGQPRHLAGRKERRARFEQPHVVGFPPPAVDQRIDQAGQQRRPQDGELLGQRIGDVDERVGRRHERRRGVPLDEGERARLLQAGAAEHAANHPVARHDGRERRRGGPQNRERGGNPIESPVAADFFDQIRLAGHVHAERRDVDEPAIRRGGEAEAQPAEDSPDVGVGHACPRAGA